MTGIAGNICVLFTANDAYMRDLKIFAPADCMVSNTAAENDHALQQIRTTLKGNLTLRRTSRSDVQKHAPREAPEPPLGTAIRAEAAAQGAA